MNSLAAKPNQEEREYAAADIRTVVVGGGIAEPPKIILSPRVEIHRVHKAHGSSPFDDQHNHHAAVVDQHPPPQVIFTTTSSRASITPGHSHIPLADQTNEQQPMQRVQVIKDGRCFYAEESITVTLPRIGGKDNGHVPQHRPMIYSSSSPPPLLIHQTDSKKVVLSRQVNVISNIIEDEFHGTANGSSNGHQAGVNGGSNNVFRPPVVSSTSTPMRPPPPPPPPRSKVTVSEEPSSSIPDLGECFNTNIDKIVFFNVRITL